MPPPFSPPAPPARKKNNVTLILLLVFIAFALVCVLPGFFVFKALKTGFTQVLPVAECAMAFEDVHTAVLDYAKDHDGLLPNAETWQDDVRPYYKKVVARSKDERGPFSPMDADSIWGCRVGEDQRTGMAFNSELSGAKLDDIKGPSDTPLIFEIEEPIPNAHEAFRKLDPAKAPKIFGESRDWMVANVKGHIDMQMGRSRSAGIKIDTGRSKEDPAPESGEAPAPESK